MCASQPLSLESCFKRQACHRVHGRADREGDKHFISVQARVVVAQMLRLQVLNWLDDGGGDEKDLMVNARRAP